MISLAGPVLAELAAHVWAWVAPPQADRGRLLGDLHLGERGSAETGVTATTPASLASAAC
jgi:hypothetical protein